MKARKTLSRLAAMFMAVMLLAALAIVPAGAVDYNASEGITFTKTIDMSGATGATVPNATYTYSIMSGTALDATEGSPAILAGPVGATITQSVQFTSEDVIPENKLVTKDVTVDLSSVTFTAPGIYRWVITETDPEVVGLTTDGSNKIYLDVYVVNSSSGSGYTIASYQFSTSADAPSYDESGDTRYTGKFTGDTDTYVTYTLTIEKVVDGDMGDKGVAYDFDVDFSGLSTGTKVTVDETLTSGAANGSIHVDLSIGHNQTVTITGIPGDAVYSIVENLAENAGYTVSYTIDDGTSSNATCSDDTYTIANGSAMSSNDHDVVVTNTRNAVSPTGIITTFAPYALMVVVAAGACFFFLRRRNAAED